MRGSRGRSCASRNAEATAQSHQNTSKHLRTLAHGGLVGCRREGAFAYYRVTDPSAPGLGLLACGRLCQNDESGPN